MNDSNPRLTEYALPMMFCANHPQVETSLRCKRCDKPICTKCAVGSPTGYLCKDCVRDQQKKFDTAKSYDFPIAFVLAGILSLIGSIIAAQIGFFVILVAPVAGIVISEAVRAAIHRRRAKLLFQIIVIACVLGGLPMVVISLLFGDIWGIFLQAVFIFITGTTAYQRIKGINLG